MYRKSQDGHLVIYRVYEFTEFTYAWCKYKCIDYNKVSSSLSIVVHSEYFQT